MNRRTMLRASAIGALLIPAGSALAACGGSGASPASSSSSLTVARPRLTHGIASGDPRTDGALIWARSDVPSTMIVETSATESFTNVRKFTGPSLTPASDGTGRFRLTGLEPGQTVHYRVTVEGEDGARSEQLTGMFNTVPAESGPIRFAWSGDVVGQGWGINENLGGMAIFGAIADLRLRLLPPLG